MSLVVGKTYIGTGYNGSRILLRGPFDTIEEIRAGRAANQQLGHYDHATNPAVRQGEQAAANLQLMSEGIVACDWAADPRSNPYHHPDCKCYLFRSCSISLSQPALLKLNSQDLN